MCGESRMHGAKRGKIRSDCCSPMRTVKAADCLSLFIGGIYDDRLLVKPVKSAILLMPDANYELPYEGAKEMLLVNDVDSKDFLTRLFNAMYNELPAPKKKK